MKALRGLLVEDSAIIRRTWQKIQAVDWIFCNCPKEVLNTNVDFVVCDWIFQCSHGCKAEDFLRRLPQGLKTFISSEYPLKESELIGAISISKFPPDAWKEILRNLRLTNSSLTDF